MLRRGTKRISPKVAALLVNTQRRYGYIGIRTLFPKATDLEVLKIEKYLWKIETKQESPR